MSDEYILREVAVERMHQQGVKGWPVRGSTVKQLTATLIVLMVVGCASSTPVSRHPPPGLTEEAWARECLKHCSSDRWHGARSPQEARENNGACRLACATYDDPWYIEERNRRTMPDGELLAHGFCRPRDDAGNMYIDSERGEVILYPVIVTWHPDSLCLPPQLQRIKEDARYEQLPRETTKQK